MNELLKTMANDMGIDFYDDETLKSYAYRIIYSGLGLWCLHLAASLRENVKGMSKKGLTRHLNALLKEYLNINLGAGNELKELLVQSTSMNLGQFIRNIYEETGYLITLEDSRNGLNLGRETIEMGRDLHLFLGLPSGSYGVCGLGIYTKEADNPIFLNDLLIRDDRTPRDYLLAQFNPLDFEPRAVENPVFFDVTSKEKISKSWIPRLKSDISIAKSLDDGRFYRVMKSDKGELYYADMPSNNVGVNQMSGCEYRRLYLALKSAFKQPVTARIRKIDRIYTELSIYGELPNREYYFLLLCGWPKDGFADRQSFIIKNDRVAVCKSMLENIGIVFEE